MFERRPPSQGDGAGTQPEAEEHQHDEQQQGHNVQQQPKALLHSLNSDPVAGE